MRPTCRILGILAFALLLGLAAAAWQGWGIARADAQVTTTRFVATTGDDSSNSCTDSLSPCRSIQHAVDVAGFNDPILVSTGIYSDVSARPRPGGVVTQVVHLTKTVRIQGGYAQGYAAWDPVAYPTTLDAGGLGRGVFISGTSVTITPTLTSLRIIGGSAAGLAGGPGGVDSGGGVYLLTTRATISGCEVMTNTATSAGLGGGLYASGGQPILSNNRFAGNQASGGGGAFLSQSPAIVRDSTFISNTATLNGGGLYVFAGAAQVSGNSFERNAVLTFGGGGMYVFSANASIWENTFRNNSAQQGGGGMTIQSGAPWVSANSLISNTSGMWGGGIHLWASTAARLNANLVLSNSSSLGGGIAFTQSPATGANAVLTNTVVLGNYAADKGSGIYVEASAPRFWHTTIARNTGGDGSGLHVTNVVNDLGTVALTNTILVSHSLAVAISGSADNHATLDGVLFFGPTAVAVGAEFRHQTQGDPAFAPDGYHITAASAAIDQGIPNPSTNDVDGRPRPMGRPDLGAYEWGGRIYLPLILRQ
jgi:hypothetical protein